MAAVALTTPLSRILWPALAWTIALIFFFPIFWLVFTSFKTDADAVKPEPVSYTHLRAHETKANLVCRLLLEKKKKTTHVTEREAKPV